MNNCIDAEARDALPDLIHDRLSDLDKATLTAHVESCEECRAEVSLLQQLRAAAPLAPRIDVAKIVSALPAPMPSAADLVASAPQQKSTWARPLVWRSLTAAALLVVGSLTFANARRQADPIAAPTVAASPVAAITPAPTAPQAVASAPAESVQTPRVADVTPANGARANAGLSLAGVQDLSDDQLQALVDGLDKVKGLPSAEPEAVSIGVDDNEGLQ